MYITHGTAQRKLMQVAVVEMDSDRCNYKIGRMGCLLELTCNKSLDHLPAVA